MKKQTIKSACLNDGKLFVNNEEIVEDFEEWMYRIRITCESLFLQKELKRINEARFNESLLIKKTRWEYLIA